MSTLQRILRRSHCHGTHHLYAIDALDFVQTESGKRLAGWLLRYHKQYLAGAIDPDTRICDFQNQIIHVEDGYWGGAPRVAYQWYNRLLRHLQNQSFAEAAQAAGILGHYFTDALQPLHTGETDREALVHQPLERSIYYSYDEIRRHWINNPLRVVFQLPDGPNWMRTAMLDGACFANRKFSLLVNSYRFDAGVCDAQAGLNEVSRAAVAEVWGLAVTGWARMIERAAADAENLLLRPLPRAGSSLPLAMAMLRSPSQILRRRRVHRLLDRQVKEAAQEYRQKGYLQKWLPDEVDIKQRVNQVRRDEKIYQAELAKRAETKRAAAMLALAKQPETEQRNTVLPMSGTRRDASPTSLSLRAVDVRLLAAMGHGTEHQLARADAKLVHAQLLRLTLTGVGQRILSGQTPPTLSDVQRWVRAAKSQRVA
ncbi:MAG: zinc dependent phospholipase C family protein [Pirellulaceae bacterium]